MACSAGSGAGLNSCRTLARVGHRVAIALRRCSARAAAGRRSRSPAGASGRWRRGRCARASSSGTGPRESARRSRQWRANRSSAWRSQHQFSMICEGSSTKSQATLVPARERISTRLSRWCSRWPNSWKMVSTSRWVSSAGLPPTGGVRLPQIKPEVRPEAVGRRAAGDQRVHPGAAALVLARDTSRRRSRRATRRPRRGRCNSAPRGSHTGTPASSATRMP